jgi:hypothetical protein
MHDLDAIAATLIVDPDPEIRRCGEILGAHVAGVDRASFRAKAREARNECLRQAAQIKYGDLSPGQRVHMMTRDVSRYYAGAWRLDRTLLEDPYQLDAFRSALWHSLKSWPVSPAEKQMRRILRT